MIKNISKKTIIAEEYKLCKSVLSKAIGLMFSKKRNLVMAFDNERKVPLHMLFVFYTIDVVYLNKSFKAVEIKEGLKPFHFCNPKKKAMYVIELVNGLVRKSRTKVGDKIKF